MNKGISNVSTHFILSLTAFRQTTLWSNNVTFFRRTLLRYVRLMTWAVCLLSVCLSSVVCDVVAPSSCIGLTFSTIFLHRSLGTGNLCTKILEKNSKGF